MIRGRLPIAITSLLILLLGCTTDPDYVRTYPQLTSTKIALVTTAGVDVAVTIDAASIDKATDVGAVWGTTPNLDIARNFVLHMGKPTSASFKVEVRTQLVAGKEYYVRVFLLGDGKTVYGLPLKFTSRGSEGVVIESLSPNIVVPGDLVTVTGKRFGTDMENTTVGFKIGSNEPIPGNIKSITETQIVVTVPEFIAETANIVIKKPGDVPITSTMTVTRKLPKFESINTTDLCSGIEITGDSFLLLGKPTSLTVNGKAITPMPAINDTNFVIGVSNHAQQITVKLTYVGYEITKTFSDGAPRPVVTTSSLPSTLPESGEFVLTGTNFPTCDGLSIATDVAGETAVQITDVKSTQVTVKVTHVGCDPFKLKLLCNNQQVYLSNPVSMPELTVTSISVDHGIVGDQVTAIGTNMLGVTAEIGVDPTFFNFSFNLDQVIAATASEATITLQAPPDLIGWYHYPNGKTTLMLEKCKAQFVYTFDYQLYNLTLTDYSPKVTDGFQPLIITGTHLASDPNIKVGLQGPFETFYLTLTDVTDTQIKTVAPKTMFAGGAYMVVVYQWGVKHEFPQGISISF